MENMIAIKPNIPEIEKYFLKLSEVIGYNLFGPDIKSGPIYFEVEKYEKIKTLLLTYNIKNQYAIYDFCYICSYFEYFYVLDKCQWGYDLRIINEVRKLKDWLKDHKISSIRLNSENKGGGHLKSKSHLLSKDTAWYIVVRIEEVLMEIIDRVNEQDFKNFTIKRGATVQKSKFGVPAMKNYFSELRNYLNDKPYQGLDDLTERDKDYIAGTLFTIAEIIKPFSTDSKESYVSEKDYLVRRMKKYR
jgi:hypothetical protein